jgi:DNA-binding FadR family transcriptional regulator
MLTRALTTPSSGHRDYRQPPQRKSMHARIVRDLGMRIVAGEFAPGERLPAEATLLAEFEVSRPVLRESNASARRQGSRAVAPACRAKVRPRSEWHLLDPDVLYWLIQTQPPRFSSRR